MNEQEIFSFFKNILDNERDVSAGVAAIRTLLAMTESDKSETVQELSDHLQVAGNIMKNVEVPITSVISACALFKRFITLTTLDISSYDECKEKMLNRGRMFLKKLLASRGKIATLASPFIVDGCRIMTHSKSRVVLEALKLSAANSKHFHVYVTESCPDKSGLEMAKDLRAADIECTVILDSAVASVMHKVDMVMVGAEGVMGSGGIINKIGSFALAVSAKEMHKPLYVLAETFKFNQYHPISQDDVPNEYKYPASKRDGDTSNVHPLVDYVPPRYIDSFFTDIGILTPTAVSDELIKLYL